MNQHWKCEPCEVTWETTLLAASPCWMCGADGEYRWRTVTADSR